MAQRGRASEALFCHVPLEYRDWATVSSAEQRSSGALNGIPRACSTGPIPLSSRDGGPT